jgi:hypothetical protein
MTFAEVAPFLTSCFTLAAAGMGWAQSVKNGRKLQVVKEQTDGLAHALASANKAQGKAEGKAIGLAEGRAEIEQNKVA